MFGFGRKTVTKKTKGNACMSQGDMNTGENRKEVNKGMLSTTQNKNYHATCRTV